MFTLLTHDLRERALMEKADKQYSEVNKVTEKLVCQHPNVSREELATIVNEVMSLVKS